MIRLAPLLVLALLLLPHANAGPVAGTNVSYVDVKWTSGSQSGECIDRIAFLTVEAHLKLLLAAQTTRGMVPGIGLPSNPSQLLPNAMCATLVTMTPGVFTNACATLAGAPHAPVVASDPYFHYDGGYFHKTVSWGGVNYAYFSVKPDYHYRNAAIHGECRWGDTTAHWDLKPTAIHV